MANLISPNDFVARRRERPGAWLVDVRTPVEFREVHIEGAVSMPLDEIERDPQRLVALRPGPEAELVLVCKGGTRSHKAAMALEKAGVAVAGEIAGGTDAWLAAGLPVERQRGVVSLERQVRMVVGVGVLTGALLALFVNPAFVWLCAFFGAGLTFAGVTNWCGMALVLARMPWNRGSGGGASCSR